MPNTSRLQDRGLLRIAGDEARVFLQNLITNDIFKLGADELMYACLLTPQGRFLHDFFLFQDGDGICLECEAARRDDLLRRLKMYKLRAKVLIDDISDRLDIYASTERPSGSLVFQDPRLPQLGYRFYVPRGAVVEESGSYHDHRLHLGVPEGSADIRPEVDTVAHANLDYLNAVSWDKGCYVGQEVTAMTENRGVPKKRLVVVTGVDLQPGGIRAQDGEEVGEIRSVNSIRSEGLAMLKLAALQASLPVTPRLPGWLVLKK